MVDLVTECRTFGHLKELIIRSLMLSEGLILALTLNTKKEAQEVGWKNTDIQFKNGGIISTAFLLSDMSLVIAGYKGIYKGKEV